MIIDHLLQAVSTLEAREQLSASNAALDLSS